MAELLLLRLGNLDKEKKQKSMENEFTAAGGEASPRENKTTKANPNLVKKISFKNLEANRDIKEWRRITDALNLCKGVDKGNISGFPPKKSQSPQKKVIESCLSCCAVSKYDVLCWTSEMFLWDRGTFFFSYHVIPF